jgi:hypothetical protein
MGAAGVRDEDIGAVLNHTPRGVTRRHYNLHDFAAEKRSALERWSAILGAILTPPAGNVVRMRRRSK